jgi:hypothetical protein
MFSISLHSRATRILLERDPQRLRAQLEQLQSLTQNALAEMRSLIANLRPREQQAFPGPTPAGVESPSFSPIERYVSGLWQDTAQAGCFFVPGMAS